MNQDYMMIFNGYFSCYLLHILRLIIYAYFSYNAQMITILLGGSSSALCQAFVSPSSAPHQLFTIYLTEAIECFKFYFVINLSLEIVLYNSTVLHTSQMVLFCAEGGSAMIKMSNVFNKSFMKLQFISCREKLNKSFTATNPNLFSDPPKNRRHSFASIPLLQLD